MQVLVFHPYSGSITKTMSCTGRQAKVKGLETRERREQNEPVQCMNKRK